MPVLHNQMESQPSNVLLVLTFQSCYSTDPHVLWVHAPGSEFQGCVCSTLELLSAPHCVFLHPSCRLGWGGRALVPPIISFDTLPFSVLSSSSPGVGGLFCFLQVVFRLSYVCCIFFFDVFFGGGFHLSTTICICVPDFLIFC